MKAQQVQRIQLASALFKIKPNITANDRTACSLALGISKITICYYLAGKISNNDRALKVLEFLKARIEARQIEIDNVCQKS